MSCEASKPCGHFPRKSILPDPNAPCPNDKLAASTRTVANLAEPEYWAAICPELSVSGSLKVKPIAKSKGVLEGYRQQINENGAFQIGPLDVQWPLDTYRLARNLAILMQHGWPPTFLIMFDEVWALIHRVSSLMAGATGNACNMDVLCWYVDPNRGDAGFSPHRDRQPDDAPATFRSSDGSPMYSTCWVPLTDACPDNSCLYMLPRWADPGYFDGDDDDGPDPLNVALASKEAFQAIRAFPAEAGSAIIFSHRIIHWGSRGRKGYHTPRLSVSWGCADDAYEPPYFRRTHLPYPPMALRAALACGQMLVYHERFGSSRRQLSLYYKFFNAHAAEFHESYRAKVTSEFVAATKEVVAKAPALKVEGKAQEKVEGRVQQKVEGKAELGDGGEQGGAKGKKGAPAAAASKAAEANGKAKKDEEVKEKKKKRGAEDGSGSQDDAGAAEAKANGAGGGGGEAGAAGKASKKAKQAAAGSGAEAAGVQPSKAAKAAAAAPAAEKAAADKETAGKDKKATAVASVTVAAAPPKAADGKKSPTVRRLQDDFQDDDNDDEEADADSESEEEEGEEEEGPGWEGLLLGSAGDGDSEDDVMEDALEAMLDAELAGRGEGLEDDFDDFQDDM